LSSRSTNGTQVASTREEAVEAIQKGRETGWTRYDLLSASTAGEFLVTTFEVIG
jgi:hypothetical protein